MKKFPKEIFLFGGRAAEEVLSSPNWIFKNLPILKRRVNLKILLDLLIPSRSRSVPMADLAKNRLDGWDPGQGPGDFSP